ncbi:hypothetical protein MRB53_007349 [Persea americana]|uniref:Uncharacterized protein n=1 Tax=Persea americana TaxID=3435 RepID=A0ACC2MIY0_PERAE|nr:hypothetical protein MRB53_007349 [Persea americana]
MHLLQIKDSINYPHGSSLDEDWVGKNCCKWNRIKCNPSSSRELEALNLKENQIGGWVVTQAFSKMQSLRHINLDYNNLSTSIDSLREELLLWGNHLGFYSRALTVVSRMQSSKILSLGSNNLSANIDSLEGICKLTALRSLDLAFNGLKDNGVPQCGGNLSLLEGLYLWRNELIRFIQQLNRFLWIEFYEDSRSWLQQHQ